MHLLLLLLALVLVAINTFGAWAVSRRKPPVARLFLLAAMLLTVTAVAYAYRLSEAFWFLLAGTLLGYLASFLNARLVLGKVEWPNHLLRAVLLAGALALAWLPFRLGHGQYHLWRTSFWWVPLSIVVVLWTLHWRERFLIDPDPAGRDGWRATLLRIQNGEIDATRDANAPAPVEYIVPSKCPTCGGALSKPGRIRGVSSVACEYCGANIVLEKAS